MLAAAIGTLAVAPVVTTNAHAATTSCTMEEIALRSAQDSLRAAEARYRTRSATGEEATAERVNVNLARQAVTKAQTALNQCRSAR